MSLSKEQKLEVTLATKLVVRQTLLDLVKSLLEKSDEASKDFEDNNKNPYYAARMLALNDVRNAVFEIFEKLDKELK